MVIIPVQLCSHHIINTCNKHIPTHQVHFLGIHLKRIVIKAHILISFVLTSHTIATTTGFLTYSHFSWREWKIWRSKFKLIFCLSCNEKSCWEFFSMGAFFSHRMKKTFNFSQPCCWDHTHAAPRFSRT